MKRVLPAQDAEISVQCDVAVFSWLLQYAKAAAAGQQLPALSTANCIPVLISSDFLQVSLSLHLLLLHLHLLTFAAKKSLSVPHVSTYTYMCNVALPQMEELKSSALSFIAQNFTAVASLSHDLAGLAHSLLSRLGKVRCFMCVCLRPPYLKYLGGERKNIYAEL